MQLKYSHEAMIDLMIVNPCVTVRELAVRFGMTEGWIYKVRASSMFREKLHERAAELVDPVMAAEIEERFDSIMNRGLEVIMEAMSQREVPVETAFEAVRISAKARAVGGFGAKVAPAAIPSDPDRLERLAARLREMGRPLPGGMINQEIVDVSCTEIPLSRQAGA